jgi:hypothetical protein
VLVVVFLNPLLMILVEVAHFCSCFLVQDDLGVVWFVFVLNYVFIIVYYCFYADHSGRAV